jgi:hypothetical protein
MSHRSVGALVFFVLSLQLGFSQPLVVNGITDRNYSSYIDSVSFSVPTEPGHSYLVLADGKRVPAGITNRVVGADYHEVMVWRTNVASGIVTNRLVRFLISSSNRGAPERGLIEWTPYPQIPSANAEFAGASLQLMAPVGYPAGLQIPVIARVQNPSGHARRVNGSVSAAGQPSFRILRGHGSGFLAAGVGGTPIEYNPQVGSISAYKEIEVDFSTTWTTVSGTLSSTVWPENSRIHIIGNVTIPAGATLTIGAGTVVRINPLINITNSGLTVINGTVDQPVVFTSTNAAVLPHVRTYAWGGFFLRNATAGLVANGAIFVGGGGAASISFSPGASHRSEQAVFLVHSGARMALTNCAVINTAGQVANGYNSDITYDHCHFQRAITAGECEGGTVIVNHSAVIEFPEDNGFNNSSLADADYDGLYFTTGTHLIYNSLIGFCKDDALDSGSGGSGTMLVTNCWIESALHEANAWSGEGRVAQTYDSVLMNSGQGFECGWSTGNNSPLTFASIILSMGNSIGARFGDNYDTIGPFNGQLRVTNSFALYNYRDVWGMTWRTDNTGWYYRSNQMDIRSNYLSQANVYHPSNFLWNGMQDGWRLARFMTTPPDAPVGIGFGTWTNTLQVSTIFDGVPVRLSSFTTNPVQVDYVFQSGARPPVSGTLTFTPGETVKRIFPYGFDVPSYANPRVILTAPVGGNLTGNTNVQFVGTATLAGPRIFTAPGTQLDHARIQEGFPIGLTAPAGLPMSVGYSYTWSGGIMRTGVVTFAPGETLAWTTPPEGDLSSIDIVRVRIDMDLPQGAPLIYYVKSSSSPTPPPTTIIARGATWRYPNVAGQLPANWNTAAYSDAAWQAGPAELGFGDGDEARPITQLGSQITYYFRRTITVPDPSAFANLSLWMRRDDGAVMHFNGQEVHRSSSMPPLPAVIGFITEANNEGENAEQSATLSTAGLVAGDNLVAVEIHQDDPGSSDISFNMELIGNGVAPPSAQRVYFGEFDGQLVFAWSDATFILEQADSLTGPWTTADTASPFVITPDPGIAHRFYRLKR